jgi:hypothetical protein
MGPLQAGGHNGRHSAIAGSALLAVQLCMSEHFWNFDWGQPIIIREIIAKRIIQFAARGEQDPDQLCEQALRS